MKNYYRMSYYVALRFVSFVWLVWFGMVLWGQTALHAREASFKVNGTTNAKNGYTLSIPSEEIILISDENGTFRSLVEDLEAIDLPDGLYNYEIIYENTIREGRLTIDERTVFPVEVQFIAQNDDEETSSEGIGETNGETNVRRLSTVRVKKEGLSEKRVLTADEARKLPGTGGDVLASLDALPGVTTRGDDGDSGLIIRGGAASDVSYRYHDIVIGSPYHELFQYSVFPPEILSSLIFYPGGYPTEYDNVQGSVVDVIEKDFYEYDKPYSVDLNITLIYASLSATFQFADDFRISLGGRRSYLEGYIALADAAGTLKNLGSYKLIPVFYDTHFIFDWQIDPTRLFKVIFLFSGDDFVFNTRNSSYKSASTGEKVLIDTTFRTSKTWDSEAVKYESKQEKYEYDFTFFRYAERMDETNQGTKRFGLTNEEYTFRNDFNYMFNDVFRLNNYFKYSLDRGYGLNKIHPDGHKPPNPEDYGIDDGFGGGADDDAPTQDGDVIKAYNDATKLYFSELVDLREGFFRHRLAFGSSLITSLRQVKFDTGFIVYYDNLSESAANGDFRLRTTYSPPVNLGRLEVFGYAGRYTQFPSIAVQNEETSSVFYQDYALKTPYTYQFGTGTAWSGSGFELSVEGYYKLIRNQILLNPSFDTAYAKGSANWPTVNIGEGNAYGIEVLLRRVGKGWYTGWLSYAWSRAYVDRFSIGADVDRSGIGGDPSNNGQDYLGYQTTRVPYEENVEHSIKFISAFDLGKRVNLSFEITGGSGKSFTPKIIGTNNTFVDPNCVGTDDDPCDNGLVFVDDPRRINAGKLPWSLGINIRLDWVYYKSKIVEASFFIDVIGLEKVFYKPTGGYNYDRAVIKNDNSYQVGDKAPAAAVKKEPSEGIPIPVFGFEFKF